MRLIQRKETWVLTAQGWLFTLGVVTTLLFFSLTHIHSFLAPTSPVKADILVVEGWMPDYALKSAMDEFEKGGYQKITTTGIPIELGFYLAQYKTYAELSEATLLALGFPSDQLVAVPGQNVLKERTVASAKALRQWIAQSNMKIKSINLYSFDVHTRRSWLVFKKVLAPEIKVGVIAAESQMYDPNHWWVYSEGVRSIISEAIAYLYARIVNLKG